MTQKKRSKIDISIEIADALEFEVDVLALKYAQAFYGVDALVAERISAEHIDLDSLLPTVSGFRLLESHGSVAAKAVLFVGVKPLREFGYREIREFGRKVLASLAGAAPGTRHISLTVHGPGYGLDESEAFEAELAGILDALTSGDFPDDLQRITVVERNVGRANRLTSKLGHLLPEGVIEVGKSGKVEELDNEAIETLRTAGADAKKHVFVAMPFADEMDDVFHYGIQGAVNAAGFLCERADTSTFTGGIMEWVKQRIASSDFVIADLSFANPNVYLEVGYAWGCNRPTVLIVRDAAELKFDVKDQRCLVYKKIKDLEASLKKELQDLKNRAST